MVKSPSMPKIYDKLNIDNFNINYNQNEKNNSNVNENVYNNNNFSNRERNNASNTKINLPLFYYNKSNNYRNFGGLPKSTNFSENNELFQNRNNNYALTPHSKEEYQKLYGGIEQNNSQKFNYICSTPSYNKISENLLNKDLNLISTKESNNTNVDISPIINKLRQMFILQGIKSIFYFQRMLYVYDINHTGEISFTNLQNIIQAYNYNFSTEEIKTLFQFYDKENTGFIKYNYLFMEIFGNMDMMRYTLVKKLFDSFPKNENGSISIDVIKKSFCPIQHYEVVNGKRKTDEVYGEFLELIDIFREYASNLKGGVPKNDLTFEEFCDFFGEISLEIQNDYAFSNLIQNCWMIN
jgi:Ca2+-binding EF-hand superfamily protein